MFTRQFECLVTLDRERDFKRAARCCRLTADEFSRVLREAELMYGRPLVLPTRSFSGFTPMGQMVLASARKLLDQQDDAERADSDRHGESAIAPLLERRSVSPKRLRPPAPNVVQLDLILQAALSAPDHGGLHAWRVIEFRDEARTALADLFEQEKRRRDPLASPADLRKAREHATRAPALLAFVVSPRQRSKVPLREQWLGAGAALGNLLNGAHQLGFGAIILSGERCFDAALSASLGLKGEEFLAGFISLGSVAEVPPPRRPVLPGQVWSCWTPDLEPGDPAADAAMTEPRTSNAAGDLS